MVKALIPLIAGIVFFDSFEADAEVVWGCFLLSLLTAAITIRRNVGSAYIVAAIFFLGGGAVSLGRFTPALPYGEMLFMEIEADETVVPRSSGYGSTPGDRTHGRDPRRNHGRRGTYHVVVRLHIDRRRR